MSVSKKELAEILELAMDVVMKLEDLIEPEGEVADGSITITSNPAGKAGANPGKKRTDTL